MRIEQALEQISAIHAQVLRSEVYRGYRARSAALTSLLVLAAAVLPGLWAAVFGLGVFASRPYLPRAVGWVALYYLLAGVVLLILARPGVPSPWSVGLTFGFGQAAAAVVLWFHLERGHDA